MLYAFNEIATCLRENAEKAQTTWYCILKLYALEGIVRRANIHPKGNEMLIRGSLITRAWALPHHRPVEDIDFLADYPKDSTRGIAFIREMLAYNLEDFITYHVDKIIITPTWVDTPLPGERITLPATALGEDFTLQIDLAYDDPVVPTAMQWEYPTLIPAWKTVIHTIRPELACAWKVHGLFEFWNRHNTSWEMKDLYDIYLIINAFKLDEAVFQGALQIAFAHRQTPLSVYDRILKGTFGQSKGTLKGWDKFYRKRDGRLLVENHFVLLEKVRAFLDKFFV